MLIKESFKHTSEGLKTSLQIYYFVFLKQNEQKHQINNNKTKNFGPENKYKGRTQKY